MTQTNLILKRKKLEQRKNRLKQMEATLTVQERKNRTRQTHRPWRTCFKSSA